MSPDDHKTFEERYPVLAKNLITPFAPTEGTKDEDAYIDGILEVASESEAPRAYEVAAQMIKTVADANKDLIELHEKMKKIRSDTPQAHKNVTNNSLFVGSTKEL